MSKPIAACRADCQAVPGDNGWMRTPLAPVIVAVIACALVGCTPQPEAPIDASASPTPSASASASPSAEPTAEPTGGASLPVPSCAELVSPDDLYEYNPNVAAMPDFAPAAGSLVARVAASGVACGFVNQSSNEVVALAVGAPDAAGLSGFTTELGALGATRWNGTDGFFGPSAGQGTAGAIVDGYVIVSSSTVFVEAADAAPIVDAALSAI